MAKASQIIAARLKAATLLVTVLAFCQTAFAQITVTSATFPAAGDTLRLAIDTAPDAGAVTITPPGGAQVWDYTGLQAGSTYSVVFRPAGEGNTQVPGAEMVSLVAPGVERYVNLTSDRVEWLADYGTPLDFISPRLLEYNPPLVDRRAPINFFDINQYSSGILHPALPSAIEPTLVAALPVPPDSVRIRIAISRLDAIDAWGSLSIPGGTYNVLREKRTRYMEYRMDGKIPPLGWLDITDVALQAGFQGLGVDTVITYHFYNDVEKTPIAIVNTGSDGLRVQQVDFKYNLPTTTDRERPENGLPDTYALLSNFPNPFTRQTTLVYEAGEGGTVRLEIYNVLGERLRTLVDGVGPPGRHTQVWDATDDAGRAVASGLYFIRMVAAGRDAPIMKTHAMTLINK
jgi:FlgD Ig-like domain